MFESCDSLSLLSNKKNGWKITKIKFGIKIKILKIIETVPNISKRLKTKMNFHNKLQTLPLFYLLFSFKSLIFQFNNLNSKTIGSLFLCFKNVFKKFKFYLFILN
jgi:hypothetical protein